MTHSRTRHPLPTAMPAPLLFRLLQWLTIPASPNWIPDAACVASPLSAATEPSTLLPGFPLTIPPVILPVTTQSTTRQLFPREMPVALPLDTSVPRAVQLMIVVSAAPWIP